MFMVISDQIKMYHFTLCALALVLFGGVNARRCDDCVRFTECGEALQLARYQKTEATKQLFKSASCGLDGKIALVCCSAFSHKGSRDEDERIANHENLRLLPKECGVSGTERIVGGTVAKLYEFPWMALISYNTREGPRFMCGGSIINQRYILTAAHCVVDKRLRGVRLGELDTSRDYDCFNTVCENHLQNLPIEQIIVHEKYKGLPQVINDIALIRVSTDIDFNHKNVAPICLPTTRQMRQRTLSDAIATVSGWGFTEAGVQSDFLLKVEIPIHPPANCSALYNRYTAPGEPDVTTDQLCAGVRTKDSCNGDSGGPLIIEDTSIKPERYIQYGVVSHGPRHCGSDFPGVYTDVTKFMGWILDKLSE